MTKNNEELEPTAFAIRENLIFTDALSVIELRSRVNSFLLELTGELKNNGCKLIGNIKGLISVGDAEGDDDAINKKGHLMFSITSFEEGARFKGEMQDGVTTVTFTINVIVFEIVHSEVEKIFKKVFSNHFG
jgi:hypothetical protein